ncbi:MAG: YiaA/YiaB family inner membrane protein [Lysobacterales bacterium]
MDQYSISDSSSQWDFFVKAAFVVALISTLLGIYMIPGELVIKGYFLISSLFLVFSTITLSKTVRDGHESKRLHNKISEARTSKMIQELDAK